MAAVRGSTPALCAIASRSFTHAAYLDNQLEDVFIVLENGLVGARFWLPLHQEVEIENLHKDIDQSRARLTDETAQIQKLRDALATADKTSFNFANITYSRDQVKEDLARRLARRLALPARLP